MALFLMARISPTAVFLLSLFVVSLDGCLGHNDESYNTYELFSAAEVSQPLIDFRFSKLVKRSVLFELQPQPVGGDNHPGETMGNKSPDTTNKPDRAILKDTSLLSSNSSSKTGGNYQTESSSTPGSSEDSTNSSIAKVSKWADVVKSVKASNVTDADPAKIAKGIKWVDVAKAVKSANATDAGPGKDSETSSDSTTQAPLPQNSGNNPKTNTKIDGKSSKKVDIETKPPKAEPTKAPIEEKSSKKTVVPETSGASTESSISPSTGADQDVQISSFPVNLSNKTLLMHNITETEVDHHRYYNSSFIVNNPTVGLSYWVNMEDRPDVQINELLSQSHRRAATVKLSFDFPFYGHMVRNVTIATGGFLYTGDYVHSWLAATQYIAPLMANFDTSISNDSFVKYVDNGTAFTVQWEKVVLQDHPNSGDFTFQATLHSNGDIVFVYQKVPLVIEEIQDDLHPVKVGLSDAYIIDRTIFFVRRKTIYEYHRVNFDRQDIKNWTVIYLNALPTCLDAKDCNECVSRHTNFQCDWCPGSNRCSTGMDRYRQEWLLRGCDRSRVSNASNCPLPSHTAVLPLQFGDASDPSHAYSDKHSLSGRADANISMGASGIIAILSIIVLILGSLIWLLHSYRNPNTPSGQFLIRHRPSTWGWRRGEARYTAATIHM